jgi:hypothetical protein
MPENEAPSHPVAFLFHFIFKAAAVLWYVFCTWFSSSFVLNFVICIVFLAADFWVTKNVTGRLLVGLRWWNEATSESGTAWRFETLREGDRQINSKEKYYFWVILLAYPLAWIGLAILAFLQLKWDYVLLDIIGILLGTMNLWGYFKCSKDAKAEIGNMTSNIMTSAMQAHVQNQLGRV